MLLGNVEKPRSGVLDSTRQTGSVLGVALFGSLVGGRDGLAFGLHVALIISAALLLIAAATIFARARRSA